MSHRIELRLYRRLAERHGGGKIERGHGRDLADVDAMLAQSLMTT